MEQFEKRVSEPGIGYFTDTISLVKSPIPAVWGPILKVWRQRYKVCCRLASM